MQAFKLLLSFVFLVVLSLAFTACTKLDDKECEFKSKYIYEPIVFDEDCNCIVAGKVKYIKDCQTVALVDYGNGTCDTIATKTVCKNGKCEASAGAYTVEINIDCKEDVVDGPIEEDGLDIF